MTMIQPITNTFTKRIPRVKIVKWTINTIIQEI